MLKYHENVKLLDAAGLIEGLLGDVPFVSVESVEHEPRPEAGFFPDLLVKLLVRGEPYQLICEFKSQGQPRTVRGAAAQLRYGIGKIGGNAYGVFLAPYLSSASREICKEHDIGFADFEGNCRLVFDSVFIERLAATKPAGERRALRSLFAPKSAQVLRALMRDPARRWKVTDLAEAADVSTGHVSNVRAALIEREWADAGPEGVHISDPDALLDGWCDDYRRPPGKRLGFYTPLHGSSLQDRIRDALAQANANGHAMLASYSAADWLAPYGRVSTAYFYADAQGQEVLESALELSSIAKGENVVIWRLDDDGLFLDAVEPAPDVRCTSALQTYLDLCIAGERGREASDHLRQEALRWPI